MKKRKLDREMVDAMKDVTIQEIIPVPDLLLLSNVLTEQEEIDLLSMIDQEEWMDILKRRVQHYGYKYDYRKRIIDETLKLGELPEWSEELIRLLMDNLAEQLPYERPDQLIVNEYQPGQGISAHIDSPGCFTDGIISVSLGSNIVMRFRNRQTGAIEDIWLPRRSAVVMLGDARSKWTHEIASRKTDVNPETGFKEYRGRRVSLTFRKVIKTTK